MKSQDHIKLTLDDLCQRYDANSQDEQLIYYVSKLAVLELSGWIEYLVDDAITEHFSGDGDETLLKEAKERLGKNYGFKYDKNISTVIKQLFGIRKLRQVETDMGQELDTIKNILGMLAHSRDSLAHTFKLTHSVTVDAPSVTRSKFVNICGPLKKFLDLIRAQ